MINECMIQGYNSYTIYSPSSCFLYFITYINKYVYQNTIPDLISLAYIPVYIYVVVYWQLSNI